MGIDVPELHRRATGSCSRSVLAIRDDQWGLPTACSEWDVRELVGHLVSEHRWTPEIFAGRTVAEVGDRFDGDLLGDDPLGAWREAAAEAVTAVSGEGAMTRTVHLSF